MSAKIVKYTWRGRTCHARKEPYESAVHAVVRSIGAKERGPVTLWWSEIRDGFDVYTAKWFDVETDTFQECEILLPEGA